MLPEGWERRTLGSLARIDSRVLAESTDPSFRFRYISLSEVSEGSISEALPIYRFGDAPSRARMKVRAGDVLFSTVRPMLRGHALVDALHDDCVASTGFAVISVEPPNWPAYVYQSLLARSVDRQLMALTAGSNFPAISSKDVSELEIAVPCPKEQEAIANVLGTWDSAVAVAERKLLNSQTQWLALLGKMLHLQVPVSNKSRDPGALPPSVQPGIPELPPTPAGWTRTSLGCHLREVRRPARIAEDDTFRLLTVKRSRGGVELRESLTGREIKTPSQFYVRAGDFLISKRQIVHGACGIVPADLDGSIVSNEYAVLNTDGHIDVRFLRYLSESRYFQQTCFHSSIGVHVEKMIFKTERWLKWPFNIPPLPVQMHIVEVLDTARREINLIEDQVDLLKQEKAALMADLLTGKRRVRPTAESIL